MIRRYSDLVQLKTFEDRFSYLKLHGKVGEETFGLDRYLNQQLYKSRRWQNIRSQVIIRDDGCDLGIDGRQMDNYITIHHMNPISMEDIEEERDIVFDPEYLICCSSRTHKAIHFGDENLLIRDPIIRRPNDTCPWR